MSSTTLPIVPEKPVMTSTTEQIGEIPSDEIKITIGSDEGNKSADVPKPKEEVSLLKIEDTAEQGEAATVENVVATDLESKLVYG